ncbi:hypothetical protein RB653_010613 [Dictyostelium firmibasis]|uniref:SET domain-containing protein n=1 Tax=Dictyostelium firmibasis TaxID=79012 RepID=A0AAN7TLW7_9MYCE
MFKSFDGLKLSVSEFEGRYITATRDIDIGESILKCKSYFAVTCEDFKKNSCYNCIKLIKSPPSPQQPPRCMGCQEVWYCSEQCKLENQAKHQHYECMFFKKIKTPKLIQGSNFDADAYSEIRIIVGLLSRYYQDILLNNKFITKKEEVNIEGEKEIETEEEQQFIKDTLNGVLDLVENDINEQTNKAAKEFIDSIIDYIINLLNFTIGGGTTSSTSSSSRSNIDMNNIEQQEYYIKELTKQIRPLVQKVRCNQFGIWTKNDKCIGMAVSPSSSYFNHSCIPNCESVRDGSDMTFKSLYPIKKGEQISISYLALDKSTKRRREYLKYGYYFHCQCPRCNSSDSDQNGELEDSLDNWISKFYCHQRKCTGLYYSKVKLSQHSLNNNINTHEIHLSCSTCNDLLIVDSSFFNNKPNF